MLDQDHCLYTNSCSSFSYLKKCVFFLIYFIFVWLDCFQLKFSTLSTILPFSLLSVIITENFGSGLALCPAVIPGDLKVHGDKPVSGQSGCFQAPPFLQLPSPYLPLLQAWDPGSIHKDLSEAPSATLASWAPHSLLHLLSLLCPQRMSGDW